MKKYMPYLFALSLFIISVFFTFFVVNFTNRSFLKIEDAEKSLVQKNFCLFDHNVSIGKYQWCSDQADLQFFISIESVKNHPMGKEVLLKIGNPRSIAYIDIEIFGHFLIPDQDIINKSETIKRLPPGGSKSFSFVLPYSDISNLTQWFEIKTNQILFQ